MSPSVPPALRGRRAKFLALALPVGLAGSLIALPASAQSAASPDAVISEVYGGGGNSGASLTNDFVELGNAGGGAFDLTGWSVQYLSGAPSAATKWQATPLSGAIPAGGSYLIGESEGTGGDTALPATDAAGAIAMSAASGTIALVHSTTPLACLTAADCLADGSIKDLVGFGTALVRETTPAAGASNTASVSRNAGLTDTDDNSADLTAGAPTPRNSGGTTGGGTEPGGGPTTDPTDDPTPPDTTPGDLRIHDIQGDTRLSPYVGRTVTNVPGVVTEVRTTGSRGFWVQDPKPDSDPATSEGVWVFTNAAPTVKVGDSVVVSGKVSEYYPGGAAAGGQSLTELDTPTTSVLSSGSTLPAAEVIDSRTLPEAYVPDMRGGSIEPLELKPATYALDWLESREGMRVQVADTRVVGASNEFNETWITTKPSQNPTANGGTLYNSYDESNSGRLLVTSLTGQNPSATVGDTLTGSTSGALDYGSFGGYTLAASTIGKVKSGGLKPEVTKKASADELSVATYNVENLDPTDPQDKFDRLAQGIVKNLATPDIVSLEEIQDNNGAKDDGTVAAGQTLAQFITAIKAAGGPTYAWRSVDPQNGTNGGEPGGNIRNVFLYNPARVSFVDHPGATATTATGVVSTGKKGEDITLSNSPGLINPTSSAWADSRKPLVGEFLFRGDQYFVIGNHFVSKGGDQPLYGRFQPPTLSSETKRVAQATEVNKFVNSVLAKDPKAKIVALGDLNDFPFSPAGDVLTQDKSLTDLMGTLPKKEQYSYVFDGNSQTLDHILVSKGIKKADYDVVHINAEFTDQASDHDPQVARLR